MVYSCWFGEAWRAIVGAEETGMNAEAMGAELETASKTSADISISVERGPNYTGRETRETIAAGAYLEVPAKIASAIVPVKQPLQ